MNKMYAWVFFPFLLECVELQSLIVDRYRCPDSENGCENLSSRTVIDAVKALYKEVKDLQGKLANLEKNITDISINDSQQIAFTACRTTGVQLSNGQTVAYDHVVTNLGGGYDTNQFQFSASLSGLYQFTVTVMSGMNTIIHLRIVKNGSELVKVFSTGHWDETGTNVVNVHLHKNDRVWVQAMDTSSSLEGGFGYNCFSGNLIQADV